MKVYQDFKKTWGCSVKDIAEHDGVTHAAVRMRLNLFGTPFQRRPEPNNFEAKYGRTISELAMELDMHPNSVRIREQAHGNVYHAAKSQKRIGVHPKKKIQWQDKRYELFWLHHEHPDYETARNVGNEYRENATWLNQKP